MKKVKKTGSWVMLTQHLPVEFPVEKLSIFYAKPVKSILNNLRSIAHEPHYMDRASYMGIKIKLYEKWIIDYLEGNKDSIPSDHRDDIRLEISHERFTEESIEHFIEIVTPFGTVRLWPEEYNVVELNDALRLVGYEAYVIRYLDNSGKPVDKMKNITIREKVFYLRSRGIKYVDSMKMVSGEIKSQHLFYFDPYPQYVEAFTRNYIRYIDKKIEYCRDNDLKELLTYPATKDDRMFHLTEYKNHLQELI